MKSPGYKYDYAVIGGDMRQVYLAEALERGGGRVCHFALCQKLGWGCGLDSLSEVCGAASCLIGPIPFCKNGDALNQSASGQALSIDRFLDDLASGQSFFAGCIPDDFRAQAVEKGVRVFDLMKELQLSIFNTAATAEGAICEAIQRSPLNLHHNSCGVLGYGKCGRTLCSYLKGMHGRVCVFTNSKEECAQAALIADRSENLEEFAVRAGEFDFIFNTIPARIMDREILGKMKKSVVVIDIASAPGGADYEAARELGLNAVLCPGLPGRYAPASSAEAVKEAVERILKE